MSSAFNEVSRFKIGHTISALLSCSGSHVRSRVSIVSGCGRAASCWYIPTNVSRFGRARGHRSIRISVGDIHRLKFHWSRRYVSAEWLLRNAVKAGSAAAPREKSER